MEIYGSLNLFKMVENVVKKTKISTLSSIILDNLLRKKKQKKFYIYLLNIIYYTELFPSSSMQNFMAVWGALSSWINFFYGDPYMDPLRSKGLSLLAPRKCSWRHEAPSAAGLAAPSDQLRPHGSVQVPTVNIVIISCRTSHHQLQDPCGLNRSNDAASTTADGE